jgi:hypothetical protein
MSDETTTLSPDPNLARMPAEIWRQALLSIARGRPDNGRPISAGDAQGIAREALVRSGVVDWLQRECVVDRGTMNVT